MPTYDMSSKSLKELVEVVTTSTIDPEKENAIYEIGYREDLANYAARGGERPGYTPPNP